MLQGRGYPAPTRRPLAAGPLVGPRSGCVASRRPRRVDPVGAAAAAAKHGGAERRGRREGQRARRSCRRPSPNARRPRPSGNCSATVCRSTKTALFSPRHRLPQGARGWTRRPRRGVGQLLGDRFLATGRGRPAGPGRRPNLVQARGEPAGTRPITDPAKVLLAPDRAGGDRRRSGPAGRSGPEGHGRA